MKFTALERELLEVCKEQEKTLDALMEEVKDETISIGLAFRIVRAREKGNKAVSKVEEG